MIQDTPPEADERQAAQLIDETRVRTGRDAADEDHAGPRSRGHPVSQDLGDELDVFIGSELTRHHDALRIGFEIEYFEYGLGVYGSGMPVRSVLGHKPTGIHGPEPTLEWLEHRRVVHMHHIRLLHQPRGQRPLEVGVGGLMGGQIMYGEHQLGPAIPGARQGGLQRLGMLRGAHALKPRDRAKPVQVDDLGERYCRLADRKQLLKV